MCPLCVKIKAEDTIPKLHLDEIKKQAEKAIRDIYHKKVKAGQIHTGLLNATGRCLEDAMSQGYGQVDWNTPDAEMYQSLRQNVWHFSAAKNYQQVKDLSALLIEKNRLGERVRTFSEFRDACRKANRKFNETWLKTEYNQAIGGATMAARWVEFQKNADAMPMLKYVTVGDSNVRDEHALLDGTKRPVNDPWWNSYYPPNGWGCRCDVQQLSNPKAKATSNPPQIGISPMFNHNLAKDGNVFPEGAAYYRGVPRSVIQKSIINLPNAYKKVSGTNIKVHILHGIDEMKDNIQIARYLDKEGHKVTLLPVVGKNDDKLREIIYGTKDFIPGKNPDALIDGVLFDLTDIKNPTINNFKTRINQKVVKKSTRQAHSVVIRLLGKMTESDINRVLKGQYNNSSSLKDVWIINGNEIMKKDRSQYYKE